MEDRIKTACRKIAAHIGADFNSIGHGIEAAFGSMGNDEWDWTIRCRITEPRKRNHTDCNGTGATPEEAADACIESVEGYKALWADQASRKAAAKKRRS